MTKTIKIVAVVLLLIGLVELAASLTTWLASGSEDKVDTVAGNTVVTATAPSTQPAKPTSWDIPCLVSPANISPAADPALAKLIDQHNANQDRIVSANLTAQCTWILDAKGDPRPMTIRYQRQGEKADITCGTERCTVEMGHVKMAPGSALNVDGLYLLMFRKYDGGQFKPGKAEKPGMIRAVSDREALVFDAAIGRLIHAEIQAKEGTIIAEFSDYAPLKGNADALLPTKIGILVPAEMYPFYRAADGKISLTITTATQ